MKITASLFILLSSIMIFFGFSLGISEPKNIKLNAINQLEIVNNISQTPVNNQEDDESQDQQPGSCRCLEALCRYSPCEYCPSCGNQTDCCNEKCRDSLGCFKSSAGNCFNNALCDYGP